MRVVRLVFFVVAGMLWSCTGGEEVVHPEGDEAWEMAHAGLVGAEGVVATVEGVPLLRADVELLWGSQPEWTAEEALEAAVEREVLAQEARRRGYHDRPEAKFGRKQGLVQALLREEVEESARVQEERAERIEAIARARRRAPEGIRASHLVVLVPQEDDEGRRLSSEAKEPFFDEVRAVMDVAVERLGGRADDDALREVAAWLNEEVLPDFSEGVEAVVNEHLRFPRPGERVQPDQLPSGWTQVVRPFGEAADEAVEEGKLGELMGPARTEFGWHLIRVDEVLPEQEVDPEALQEFVESQLLLEAQMEKLRPAVERWMSGARVEMYPERLERSGVEGY